MRNIKIFFTVTILSVFSTLYANQEVLMNQNNNILSFLNNFENKIAMKEEQLNKAVWILETTGSKDAAYLVATLSNELKIIFSDEEIYEKLIHFNNENIQDPLLKRQIDILIKQFKENLLPKELIKKISSQEADLNQTYANFRAEIDGKNYTENELREIFKKEKSIDLRKKAFEASKEVGSILAPKILDLVKLRNRAARHLGYENYFEMMLDLNEISQNELIATFEDLKKQTDDVFYKIVLEVKNDLSQKFQIHPDQVGPWAFKDPFCQMDPLENHKLYEIFEGQDILEIAKAFYEKMGFDINDLIKRSDLYEKDGKNQHAFCISIDRKKDVRTLNNIRPNIQWMETLLHEFGHAVYDLSIDENLPWILREHPHVLTTEAIALLMGRQVYTKEFLKEFLNINDENLFSDMTKGFKRRQLFFSRSTFMFTEFESQLYENPDQDLNELWWSLFEKYYHLPRPENREGKADWAAKYHIGLAPVYYYAYLLGEIFAATLQKQLLEINKDDKIWKSAASKFLQDKMFFLGSRLRWDHLIEHVTQAPFSSDAWIEEIQN